MGSDSNKTSFWSGVVVGVMGLCTIGFVVLLVLFLSGSSLKAERPLGDKKTATPPTTTTGPGDAPSGSVEIAALTEEDHVRGDRNAPIVLVEYSDTECPFCKRFHAEVQQLLQNNGNTVAWAYRHFPLDSLHSKARKEAEATECAAELGGNDGFWAYLDELFVRTPSNDGLPESELPEIAAAVGINRGEFESCLSSGRHAAAVQADYEDAIAAGGTGTPYTVVVAGDERIPVNGAVPQAQLQAIIDSLK